MRFWEPDIEWTFPSMIPCSELGQSISRFKDILRLKEGFEASVPDCTLSGRQPFGVWSADAIVVAPITLPARCSAASAGKA